MKGTAFVPNDDSALHCTRDPSVDARTRTRGRGVDKGLTTEAALVTPCAIVIRHGPQIIASAARSEYRRFRRQPGLIGHRLLAPWGFPPVNARHPAHQFRTGEGQEGGYVCSTIFQATVRARARCRSDELVRSRVPAPAASEPFRSARHPRSVHCRGSSDDAPASSRSLNSAPAGLGKLRLRPRGEMAHRAGSAHRRAAAR